MKFRQTFLQAVAAQKLSGAMAVGLLLFGSSCSSSRNIAQLFHRQPRHAATSDPFADHANASRSEAVTHAYTDVKAGREIQVTQLAMAEETRVAQAPADNVPADTPRPDVPSFAEATEATSVAARPRSFPAQALSPDDSVAQAAPSSVPSISQTSYADLTAAAAQQRAVSPAVPVNGESSSSEVIEQVETVSQSNGSEDPFLARPAARAFPTSESESTQRAAAVPETELTPFDTTGFAPQSADVQLTSGVASSASTEIPAHVGAPVLAQSSLPLESTAITCPPLGTPFEQCPPVGPSLPLFATPGLYQVPAIVADEYLCDGGDKELPVHYLGADRYGLDTEDTVVEFKDHEGRAHVKPSTKACVYAPRFAAVLSVSEPLTGFAVEKASGAHDGQPLAALHNRLTLDEQVQRESLYAMHMRARASALHVREADDQLTKDDRVNIHAKLINAFEDYGFIREGLFGKVDVAILEAAIEAAFAWDGDLHVMVYAHDQSGQAVIGKRFAEDLTGTEDRSRPGDLQIVKVADKASAHPGDVVTFTIRFDNVGDKELVDVRVVDHLTPRLKFIEGSIQSSALGEMHLEDNSSGGKVLTFQFSEPLKGKTGAFVTFQCRVL